jgi:hypothetical protein
VPLARVPRPQLAGGDEVRAGTGPTNIPNSRARRRISPIAAPLSTATISSMMCRCLAKMPGTKMPSPVARPVKPRTRPFAGLIQAKRQASVHGHRTGWSAVEGRGRLALAAAPVAGAIKTS